MTVTRSSTLGADLDIDFQLYWKHRESGEQVYVGVVRPGSEGLGSVDNKAITLFILNPPPNDTDWIPTVTCEGKEDASSDQKT